MLAIIGGTGLNELANLKISHRQVIRTPYGEPSGALTFGKINEHSVVFLARHGYGRSIPPHQVNYRANIWALADQQVKHVIAVASVGGIRSDLTPGTLVVPNQMIDYTYGRKFTYFDGDDRYVTHIDFTLPYCEQLRLRLLKAALEAGETIINGGVYAATQGPRLETAAEINRLEKDGADMVGMTGMPEAALAKELNLSYAALGVVANYGAGRGPNPNAVDLSQLSVILDDAMRRVRKVLEYSVTVDGD